MSHQNYVTTASNNSLPKPIEIGRIPANLQRMREIIGRASQCASSLESHVASIDGGPSGTDKTQGAIPQRSGLAGQFEDANDDFESVLSRLSELECRLANTV